MIGAGSFGAADGVEGGVGGLGMAGTCVGATTGDGALAPGALFLFIISSRSNSLMPFAGPDGAAVVEDEFELVFDFGCWLKSIVGGLLVVVAGEGIAGVIAPSVTTGFWGVRVDQPLSESGLLGDGAAPGVLRLEASGVAPIFGLAEKDSEIICGPGGLGAGAGVGLGGFIS